VLSVRVFDRPEKVRWKLPPSKSHMIRWMVLAAQSNSSTELEFDGIPGKDIRSMADCLERMGARIDRGDGSWLVRGGIDGLHTPNGVLFCGNSATTARVVTAIAAGLVGTTKIDGDISLRERSSEALVSALVGLGCSITSERLPCEVSGPIMPGASVVNQAASSQTLTALLLASPNYPEGTEIRLVGEAVSRGYTELTIEICESCGMPDRSEKQLSLDPWELVVPEKVAIPGELSLLPMAMLIDKLHGTKCHEEIDWYFGIGIMPAINDVLKSQGGPVDLRDASDIISPAAALLALGNGGEIIGAPHAKDKESDRIGSTVDLMRCFGIEMNGLKDGMAIPGGQFLKCPENPIRTRGDHRLAMTAIVLASAVGGKILEHRVCDVTHPEFVEMIMAGE